MSARVSSRSPSSSTPASRKQNRSRGGAKSTEAHAEDSISPLLSAAAAATAASSSLLVPPASAGGTGFESVTPSPPSTAGGSASGRRPVMGRRVSVSTAGGSGSGSAKKSTAGGRSRRSSVMQQAETEKAAAAAAASLAAQAAAAAASAASAAAAAALASAAPRFAARPALSNNALQTPSLSAPDSAQWIYRDTAPQALPACDPQDDASLATLTLVTTPRKKATIKAHVHTTVRQMYAHAKFASGCTEAFDLLFSYPYRILNPPDATLADLGLEAGASLLQRPYSELPPPSAIRAKADATLTIGGGASSSYTAAAATKR